MMMTTTMIMMIMIMMIMMMMTVNFTIPQVVLSPLKYEKKVIS